ncbi:MAG: response regulator [bacterium]
MPNHLAVELPDMQRLDPRHPMADLSQSLPLRGVTILAVEDSRFASEALRLMCRRLGARLRRAETLQAARSHLKLYRPTVVLVDLGLPDGRGEALIREIVTKGPGGPIVLGTSGDITGRASALAAGADGFLEKPLESIAAFQNTLIRHLPDETARLDASLDPPLQPDNLALRDDFARAAALIEAGTDAETQIYLSGFLTGVARHAHDAALAEAAECVGNAPLSGRLDQLRQMLAGRLANPSIAFGTNAAKA